jgi:hypothetical protein
MLGLAPSIHALNTAPISEVVDGRDKPDHDGKGRLVRDDGGVSLRYRISRLSRGDGMA